ncbi:MAG: hypothetical protein KAW17_05675 [Candidatus Eisenbacteria sp.]|nr:hypothetical protein [Candidatus Eisenbacteria bacterium]
MRLAYALLTFGVLALFPGCGGDAPTAPSYVPTGLKASIFDHIKTFEICHDALDDAETDFIATHYDVFVGTGIRFPRVYETNPNILVLSYILIRANSGVYFGPSCEIGEFCAETFAAAHGYDVEDFFLHYREDVSYLWNFPDGGTQDVFVPGWNPEWQPGDPPASASAKSESRVWGRWKANQRWANVASRAWQHWRNEYLAHTMRKGNTVVDGVFVDGVVKIVGAMSHMMLDKTIEYWGETVDAGFSMIDDHYSYMPVLRDFLEQELGEPKIVLGNAEASYYLASEPVNSGRFLERFDWLMVENGVRYDPYVTAATCSYDVQFQDVLGIGELAASGRKILFGAKDNSESERGRIFILATFYLINHPNLYFCDHKGDLNWFDAIAQDVGEPLGSAYVWASGPDPARPASTYHIMAREYTNALVLVKHRDSASYFLYFGTETMHDLGGTYRALSDDGTLGDPITEIELRNNEAAILIPQ